MNNLNKVKAVLVVIGLLFIGFVGGFFSHKAMVENRLSKLAAMRAEAGFRRHFLENIDATEAQKEKLVPVIKRYAIQMEELHAKSREHRRTLIEQMKSELKVHLTETQVAQMEKLAIPFRGGPKSPRFKRGRPKSGRSTE